MHAQLLQPNTRGYVLLSMLALLLGVGGGWISLAGFDRQSDSSSLSLSKSTRNNLVDARQALVSYSVLYPFMYGPAGAGPGHFPCPDTDGFTHYGATTATAMDQRRDGPNPPCNSWSGSTGKLPRHVALPEQRYLFHAQPSQHYGYMVAGNVVNNPLNRIVNLSDLLESADTPTTEIRISVSETVVARVAITGSAIVDATAASVAAWVIQRSTQNGGATLEMPDSCDENSIVGLLLDHPITLEGPCVEDSLSMNSIEGVPALRHWFIRNHWHTLVKARGNATCEEHAEVSTRCVLHYPLIMRKSLRDSGVITLIRGPAT